MKIKLGSIITEAKGKIGGTYVGHSRWGHTLARKRSRSGQAIRNRAHNSIQLQFYSHRWNSIAQSNRNRWIQYYGSKLKGFRQYVTQAIYRVIAGATVFDMVDPSQTANDPSVTNVTYTQATQSITITLATNGTTAGQRIVQIRNYSPSRSHVGISGWLTIRLINATASTAQDISTSIKATGRQVTNNTTFQLRIVQCNNNSHPVIFMNPITIQTGP